MVKSKKIKVLVRDLESIDNDSMIHKVVDGGQIGKVKRSVNI